MGVTESLMVTLVKDSDDTDGNNDNVFKTLIKTTATTTTTTTT